MSREEVISKLTQAFNNLNTGYVELPSVINDYADDIVAGELSLDDAISELITDWS